MSRYLLELFSPDEFIEFGRSDLTSDVELMRDRDAVRPFCDAVLLMVGDEYFVAYMTALTAIERVLRMKASRKQ